MKKKNIVITILTFILIACCSIGTISFIQKNTDNKNQELDLNSNQMSYELAHQVDTFSKTLLYDVTRRDTEGEKPMVNFVDPDVVNNFNYYRSSLFNDPNIQYMMELKGEVVRSNTDAIQPDDWEWYAQVVYDQEGNCENAGSNSIDYCAYIEFMYYYPIDREDGVYEAEPVAENPQNVTFTFALPKELKSSGYFYDTIHYISHENDYQQSEALFFSAILVVTFILFVYMMLVPYRMISEVNPYQSIKKFKLFTHMVILGIALPLLTAGGVEGTRALVQFDFNSQQFISKELFTLGCVCYFMIYYSFILWFFFWFKSVIKKGIPRYLKEDTYTGSVIRGVRSIMHEVTQLDLGKENNQNIFKFVVLNMVILFFGTLIPGLNFIFILVYSFLFYHFIKKKCWHVQEDYKKLLKRTQRVAQGDFSKEESSYYGYFQSLGDEFDHIQEGFEKAVNEEVKSSKVKTELISNVSHDLKTPLTSIITYIDLMKQENTSDEEKANYLEILERNSLRLKHLIDDLFEVSKVNSGDIQLNLVEVDLVSLMNQTLFENEDQLAQKNLDVRLTKNQEKMMVICDSLKTYRIFENLINNISKYALANTRVYLALEEKEHEIVVSFKNISECEMNFSEEEITDRFVRGDKSRNSEGSGLGLAIVKSFAEVQHATFHIETDGDLFKATVTFMK